MTSRKPTANTPPETLVLAPPPTKWPGPAIEPPLDPAKSRALADVLRRYPLEPTILVSGDATVEECAMKMKELKLSAVLVSESPTTVDGLFSDRDLFLKMNSKVAAHKIWQAPVRTVMSRPVMSVAPELVHLAPAMMAEHHIHHLPIMGPNNLGQLCVFGILTVDGIFRQNLVAVSDFHDYSTPLPAFDPVGILSEDKFLSSQIEKTLKAGGNALVRTVRKAETMNPSMLQAMALGFRNLIIDVDTYDAHRLGRLLKLVLTTAKMKRVVLLYTPDTAAGGLRKLLTRLSETPPFVLLPKPIEAAELAHFFE